MPTCKPVSGDTANSLNAARVIFLRSVRDVQAEHVHARFEEFSMSRSGLSLAGPSVATIFVVRMYGCATICKSIQILAQKNPTISLCRYTKRLSWRLSGINRIFTG